MILTFLVVAMVVGMLAYRYGLPFEIKNIWVAMAVLIASILAMAGCASFMADLEKAASPADAYLLPMIGGAACVYVMASLMAHARGTADRKSN
jgi:peptidoglycan/LPS O-acetylase OafA/YrhL